jgi:hypothetical protein
MQEAESLLRKKRPSSIDNLTLPAPQSILGMGLLGMGVKREGSAPPRPGR